jgi:FSR family fosmidomycin resistance protein-like MFS transporter
MSITGNEANQEGYLEPTLDREEIRERSFQTSKVFTFAFAHAIHDTYTAFVAPILPVLIENLSLTKTMAGALTIFTQLPSLFQPFIGHVADRVNLRPLVILAPGITGIMLSLIGVSPHYVIIALLLTIAGFSSAALHAVGPVMAGHFSGDRLGRGMSFWMVGGEVGRVLGPLVIVTALGYLTLPQIPWLMIGGLLTSVLLYFRLRNIGNIAPRNGNGLSIWAATRQMKPLLLPLAFVLIAQGYMSSALTTYLPTFLTGEGANLWFAGASLSFLEAAGVAGALLAGSISDRLGRKRILLISLLASPVFMIIFLWMKGWMQIPFLLVLGFSSISITPVIMAIVQESYPENRALANGVYMAMSFIIRSLLVLVIGMIGDHLGLRFAFYISALMMFIGIPFIFMLPDRKSTPLPGD